MAQIVQLERTQYRQLLRRAELLCDSNNIDDKVFLPRTVANQLFHESRAYHYLKISLRIHGICLDDLDGLGDAHKERGNKARTTRRKPITEVATSNLGKIDERHEEDAASGELEKEKLKSERTAHEALKVFTSAVEDRSGQKEPALIVKTTTKNEQHGNRGDISQFCYNQFTKPASREKSSRGTHNPAVMGEDGSLNEDNFCISSDIKKNSKVSCGIKEAKAVKMIHVYPKLVDISKNVNSVTSSRRKSGAAMVFTSSAGGESLIERVKNLKLQTQKARISAQTLAGDDSKTKISERSGSSRLNSRSGIKKKENFTREIWW